MALVDTDVMIDVLREFAPALGWLASLGTEEIIVPGYVALELLQGCRNRTEQAKVERTLVRSRLVWPSTPSCNAALSAIA